MCDIADGDELILAGSFRRQRFIALLMHDPQRDINFGNANSGCAKAILWCFALITLVISPIFWGMSLLMTAMAVFFLFGMYKHDKNIAQAKFLIDDYLMHAPELQKKQEPMRLRSYDLK